MKRALLKIGFALMMLIVATSLVVANAQGEGAAAEEPLVITWFAWRGIAGEDAPIPPLVEDMISQKVGFPVQFNMVGGTVDGDMHNAQQMMLAANELPDVFNRFNIDPEFLAQAATKFELETMTEQMPEMYKFLGGLMDQLNLDPDIEWAKYQDTDGMLWGVPRIWDMGWVPSGQMWREDIVEELGYDVPTTIAEAEEVFAAFKSVYPDKYPVSGRGKTSWQCFDMVFNAYGLTGLRQAVRDGVVKQFWATREFREALLTLKRWYDNEWFDPDFQNQGLELYENWAAGNYIAVQWMGRGDWDFNTGEDTRYSNNLRDNVPGARADAYTHIVANPGDKPVQGVWNPFLTQLTVLGKQLENDTERLYKIMQVGDVLALDREVKFLSGSGIEGEHYELVDGVPKALPPVAGMPTAELADKYGIGFIWQGNFSTYSLMNTRSQKVIDDYVNSPDGPYHSSKLDLAFPVVGGAVKYPDGEDVVATTPTGWFDMTVAIMTGEEPIEYYDEWLESYYDAGGRDWEENATRLWGPK